MASLQILCIGDCHIRKNNLPDIETFLNELKQHLSEKKYDVIVIMGDTLHTHEMVHSPSFKMAYKYFKLVSSFAMTFILIGNHDYINNSQFLSTEHPFIMLNEPNIMVVDTLKEFNKNSVKLLFCPYVPDGRFIEALKNSSNDFKTYDMIFGHQLLNGAKMGAITASKIEEWKEDYPLVVSGHIHGKQIVQDNLHYVGSCLQHSYGDSADKSISCYEVDFKDKSITYEEIYLDLPIKKIIYADEKTINECEEKIKTNLKNTRYKIVLTISQEVIRVFKKSSLYESLSKKAKISFRTDIQNKTTIIDNANENTTTTAKKVNFHDILKELIKDDENQINIYKTLTNNQ